MDKEYMNERINEVRKMIKENIELDMGASELYHFYMIANEVFETGNKDKIFDALYDSYLFGVSRGLNNK